MKAFLIIATLITILFGSTYFMHSNNVESARNMLEEREKRNRLKFDQLHRQTLKDLRNEDQEFASEFEEIFVESFGTVENDTAVNLFVYGQNISYQVLDLDYITCAKEKATNDVINRRVSKSIDQKLDSLNNVLGGREEYWINRMKGEKHRFWENDDYQCNKYYDENIRRIIKPKAFDELISLIKKYRQDEKEALATNRENEAQFNREYTLALRKLNADGKTILKDRVQTNPNTSSMKFIFSGDVIGNVDYTFNVNNYSLSQLEKELDYALTRQYDNHSLGTGSMPYSYCYGSENYGASSVKVNAGGGDVLVMIKNMSNRVVRHAYIRSKRSYTLNVPNGSYRVFFYHGSGWNPHKFMKNTTCGELTGGFINNESVTKDPSTLFLNNQIMTYTLTQVINGNFNTAGSNKNEAF